MACVDQTLQALESIVSIDNDLDASLQLVEIIVETSDATLYRFPPDQRFTGGLFQVLCAKRRDKIII